MVEQSRFKIAGALLHETDLRVQDVAAKLGYATPGAFARACARWAGCSPSTFRAAPPARSHGAQHWREAGSRSAAPGLGSKGNPEPSEKS
ncbi:MAG: AraC family transcriptional regulator [Alphaproteobacteria bacterium]|nr:AraC family transcriptional regulator [Alphaproteobacteria bacterium]